MLSQQTLEYQSQPQPQARSQAQPQAQQQPPIMLHQSSLMNQTDQEFADDRANMMMNEKFQSVSMSEQERSGLIANIRDLQQSYNELQLRFRALAQRTDEVMKLNDIFKEELSNVNYDFVSALELLKEQFQYQQSKSPSHSPAHSFTNPRSHSRSQSNGETEQTQSQPQTQSHIRLQSHIISAVENIQSKVLERIAYRDMNFKSISYQSSLSDPSTQFSAQGPTHQSFAMSQSSLHPLQPPYSSSNSTIVLPRAQPSIQRSGSQPALNSQSSIRNLSTSQQPLQQIRHLSTPSPNGVKHNIAMSSLPPEVGSRNPSSAPLTSNPYSKPGYSQISSMYNCLPEYSQQQAQQQPLSQPLLNKSLEGNTKSSSSLATKVPTSRSTSYPHSSFIQQNGPTSNPQPFHLQKANSSGTNNGESPFLHKDIRYSVSLSSDRSRNASVYDPLQPLPLVPPLPMQIIPTNQSNISGPNFLTGPVQFYQNGQSIGPYPIMDPNAISRQYSLTQMYSPVGHSQSGVNISGRKNENDETFNANENSHMKQHSSFEGRSPHKSGNLLGTGTVISPLKKHTDIYNSISARANGNSGGDSYEIPGTKIGSGDSRNGNADILKNDDSKGRDVKYVSRSNNANSRNEMGINENGENANNIGRSSGDAVSDETNKIEQALKSSTVRHILSHGPQRNVDHDHDFSHGVNNCDSKDCKKGYIMEIRHRGRSNDDSDEGTERNVKKMKT
ncbi:hypothetical protein PMKS-003618 [Pichia membranifaciens]|uniref:Uncharacterized protein n=1 Tax=Pichia membranifaciens TaxID=4926 RepID=A0A1Q2YKV0_9ASCO|nr:hypothetical protein PMKS-003618 [Pichia membranifaciens]